jgi:carbon monoxide dehydrogenase subunit G
MRMSFSGAPEVEAPISHVWPRVVDPHFVAKHGPGVESVEVLDPHHFKVLCAFGVGSIKLRFGLDVELADVNPPNYFTIKVRGKAPGSAVEVTAELALEVMDTVRTRMSWKAVSDISGTVASVGARLMEGTARKLTEQFWIKFAASISEAGPPPEATEHLPPPTPPTPDLAAPA